MSIRSLVVVFCLLVGISESRGNPPQFKSTNESDTVSYVTAFSDDKQVGTMLFHNLQVATPIGKPALPSVETLRFSHVLTIDSTDETEVTYDIRGFVMTHKTGSASLLIHSAGKSTLVNLDHAIKDAKTNTVGQPPTGTRAKALESAKAAGFSQNRVDKSDDFFYRVKRHVPAGSKFQTTIVLLVDRLDNDEDSAALLTVDSVDITLTAVPKKPAK